jgi:hypothetical protein
VKIPKATKLSLPGCCAGNTGRSTQRLLGYLMTGIQLKGLYRGERVRKIVVNEDVEGVDRGLCSVLFLERIRSLFNFIQR